MMSEMKNRYILLKTLMYRGQLLDPELLLASFFSMWLSADQLSQVKL